MKNTVLKSFYIYRKIIIQGCCIVITNIVDTKSDTEPRRAVKRVVMKIKVHIKYCVIRIWGLIRNFTKASKFNILVS